MSSACDVRAMLRGNWNGLETHDWGGKKEDRNWRVCEGKIRMIHKCVARFRCSVEVAQEKVVGLYTNRSSHEEAEHFRVSARTSNKYTV